MTTDTPAQKPRRKPGPKPHAHLVPAAELAVELNAIQDEALRADTMSLIGVSSHPGATLEHLAKVFALAADLDPEQRKLARGIALGLEEK